ncbi:MAG: hypothetical protein JSR82_07685 [Verrucomicrobia bacterium]|nr:hypothetical protein [Verrucomicrobiota bacterium]
MNPDLAAMAAQAAADPALQAQQEQQRQQAAESASPALETAGEVVSGAVDVLTTEGIGSAASAATEAVVEGASTLLEAAGGIFSIFD